MIMYSVYIYNGYARWLFDTDPENEQFLVETNFVDPLFGRVCVHFLEGSPAFWMGRMGTLCLLQLVLSQQYDIMHHFLK